MSYIEDLRHAVESYAPRLKKLSDDVARRPLNPGKWSPREVIGHLIDSASNNHQRFVRAQFQDALVFPGYSQDEWVAVQKYSAAPWEELVTLWRTFNLHIAHVMEVTSNVEKQRPRKEHNLDELAWKPVPRDQPATLDYFMADYVGHLQHHLDQIFPR